MRDFLHSLVGVKVARAASLQPNPGNRPIEGILANFVYTALGLLGAVAIGMLIYGGVLFILSQGDPEKTTRARNTLLWAVVGIILIAASYGIVVYFNKLI